MKGVILAGGTGTRLKNITADGLINKHLVAVGDTVMVEYPLYVLLQCGIKKIVVVAGGDDIGGFMNYLGSGDKYGCSFTYRVQSRPGGIAEAMWCAAPLLEYDDSILFILGDNLYGNPSEIKQAVDKFDPQPGIPQAHLFLKEVAKPQRFGVAALGTGNPRPIMDLVEKPKDPPSRLAVTGAYLYSSRVLSCIHDLKPSGRGELEVTDLNKKVLTDGKMTYSVLKGFWSDMGTQPSRADSERYLRAHSSVHEAVKRQRRT